MPGHTEAFEALALGIERERKARRDAIAIIEGSLRAAEGKRSEDKAQHYESTLFLLEELLQCRTGWTK